MLVFLTIVNQLLRVGLFWLLVSMKKLRRMICMRPFPSSERSRTCILISTGELDLSRFDSMLSLNKRVRDRITFLYSCIQLNRSVDKLAVELPL